jgi:nicotinate-nucleotide--dimethylbenzimidazole phosphoribosyltransferase
VDRRSADLSALLRGSPAPDPLARQAVAHRTSQLLVAGRDEARFEGASWLAAWQGTDCPDIDRPVLLLVGGSHEEDERRSRAITDAVRAGGAAPVLVAAGVDLPVRFVDVPGSDAVGSGIEHASSIDADLIVLTGLAPGAEIPAAAVAAVLGGASVDLPGAGEEDFRLLEELVERGVQGDPIATLERIGGPDVAFLVGLLAGARARALPVVLDGAAALAAACVVDAIVEGSADHCLLSGTPPGFEGIAPRLGVVDLGLPTWGIDGLAGVLGVMAIRLGSMAVVDGVTVEEWGLR